MFLWLYRCYMLELEIEFRGRDFLGWDVKYDALSFFIGNIRLRVEGGFGLLFKGLSMKVVNDMKGGFFVSKFLFLVIFINFFFLVGI